MLRCFAIAQADAHVTNEIIRIGTTEVSSMVPMWPKDDYKQKLTRDLKLSELDNLLRNCYNEANSAGFAFEFDKYGGYGLLYKGRQQLKIGSTSDTNHLPGTTGFLEKLQTIMSKVLMASHCSGKPNSASLTES